MQDLSVTGGTLETGPYAHPAQAALALRRALAGDPRNLTFRLGLMELYRRLGRLEEARRLGEEEPAPGVTGSLAVVLAELGDAGAALARCAGHPDEAALLFEAGYRALAAAQYEAADQLLARGLALDPAHWLARIQRVNAQVRLQRLDVALELAARTFADPEVPLAGKALAGFLTGVCHLLEGRLAEGLPWMEWRHQMEGGPNLDPLPLEPWRGEAPAGLSLLLRAEQGFGDAFMMARYVPLLARQGARVFLQPQPGTRGLLETVEGLEALVDGEAVLPAGTRVVPVMSLPWLCGTTLDTVPGGVPYLRVPADVPSRAAIDACLDAAPPGRRIGLVWAGNPAHHQDAERSMPPEMLEVLAEVPGVTWVDFQVARGPRPALPLVDLAAHLSDFSDSAYALSRLDGLISIDSSPVHLAGALGLRAWVALAHCPDWRWMLARRDSPWYPTLELWRQPAPGDWAAVVHGMRDRLLAGAF